MRARGKSGSSSSVSPGEVRAHLRIVIRLDRALGVLVVAATVEVFRRRADAQRSAQWKEHVHARVLQEVVRTHTVERIDLTPDVKEEKDFAAIARQARERAEIRPGTVVVKTRPFGDALTGARCLLLGLLSDAERQ